MSRTTCGIFAAGLLAVSLPILTMTTIGARAAPLSGATQDSSIDTAANTPTDFSSARGGGGRGGGGGGRMGGGGGRMGGGGGRMGGGGGRMGGGGGRMGGGGGGRMGAGGGRGGHHASGRAGGGRTGQHHAGRTGGSRTGSARTGGSRTGTARTGGSRTGTARTGGARTGGARTGTAGGRVGGARVGTARVGGGRTGTRTTTIRNRRVTTFTGRRFWWHGGWRTLVGIGLLTPWVLGGIDYYPDGYLAYSQPQCTGYTDDGCALRWQDVAADDGSTIPQCVQFCPRERKGPPPGAQLAPAPLAAGQRKGCEVEVFSDKNLQGQSFKTTEDQPLLNDQWNKQISSINVIAGTWDFSTEAQYNGDVMRLTPGAYKDLGPNWDDQIGSFQCVQ
jgi:hypothetical protein